MWVCEDMQCSSDQPCTKAHGSQGNLYTGPGHGGHHSAALLMLTPHTPGFSPAAASLFLLQTFPLAVALPYYKGLVVAFLLTVDHLRPSSAAKFFAIQWATITSFPIGVTLSLKKGTFYTCVSFFKHFLSKLRYALLFFFIFIATVL